MAENKILAYGEITILDLLDTATYIYYAKDESGAGASKTPAADSKYMGIYSGPPFDENPSKFPMDDWKVEWWSGWQKYMGDKGADGKDGSDGLRGTGILKVKTAPTSYTTTTAGVTPIKRMAISTIKTQSGASEVLVGDCISYSYYLYHIYYLDTTYAYMDTYQSIRGATGEKGNDGEAGEKGKDANEYKVESSVEEILQIKGKEAYEIAPNSIDFRVFKKGELYTSVSENCGSLKFFSIRDPETVYSIVTLNFTNSTWTFNFDNLGSIGADEEDTVKTAFNAKRMEPLVFVFTYKDESQDIFIEKRLVFHNGTTADMLNFSVTAGKIQALTNSSKMTFDDNGLTISGAYFKIQNDEGTTVLHADDSGNLSLDKILAKSGNIGGFTIKEDNSLVSADGTLALYGKEGRIEAKNIDLGEGAKITSAITFDYNNGKGSLLNPGYAWKDADGNDDHSKDGVFILGQKKEEDGTYTDTLKIYANGRANFGNIHIDGANSTLKSATNDWTITPTTAEFKNIIASGTIKTAVFETESTQAVGSAMMFMPSYTIKEYDKDNKKVVLDKEAELEKDVTVWLVKGNNYSPYQIFEIDETKKVLTFYEDVVLPNEAEAMLVIGNVNNSNKPLIMGINSGEVHVGENLVLPRGLTINEYGASSSLPKLFLGDLSKLDIGTYKGYGLYADNVYLNGSLTTNTGGTAPTYAGINTNTDVTATIFSATNNISDNSRIIFWAGANGTNANQIQEAPFQVTEQGSIYASSAELTNSVFVNGQIKGADIYAARIHGIGGTDAKALKIYDTGANGGIGFYTGYSSGGEGTETCRINTQGFYTANSGVSITFKDENSGEETVLSRSGLQLKNNGIKLEKDRVTFTCQGGEKVIIEDVNTYIDNTLKTKSTMILGEDAESCAKFQRVEGGYDLYIIKS